MCDGGGGIYYYFVNMALNTEWHERSFLIELKPRAEFANLFVDCPPSESSVGGDENQYGLF